MLRSLVIGRIGSAGDKAVVDEAKKRFAAHCDGSAELPADLRSAVSSFRKSSTIYNCNCVDAAAILILNKYLKLNWRRRHSHSYS